jgi:hypothetical protein
MIWPASIAGPISRSNSIRCRSCCPFRDGKSDSCCLPLSLPDKSHVGLAHYRLYGATVATVQAIRKTSSALALNGRLAKRCLGPLLTTADIRGPDGLAAINDLMCCGGISLKRGCT